MSFEGMTLILNGLNYQYMGSMVELHTPPTKELYGVTFRFDCNLPLSPSELWSIKRKEQRKKEKNKLS